MYAGFWRRFAAYFVDGLVLLVPSALIGWALSGDHASALAAQVALGWLYTASLESGQGEAASEMAEYKEMLSAFIQDDDASLSNEGSASGSSKK